MPKVNVDGVQIHYEIEGQGTPLLLTTGQGTGHEARAKLIDGLARHHTVLSYDQRGTGRSDRVVRQGHTIEELTLDVIALMDVASFSQAQVIGISTGTGKATVLAASYPKRVTRLVLGAPWTHGDAELRVLQNMRKAAARTMPSDLYTHFNSLLIYPPEYRREHFERFAKMARDAAPQDADGISRRLDAILAFDARPFYPKIVCPTLVMCARDDLVMPTWFALDAAGAIPGARLVELEGGGHLFAETRTDEFLRNVLPFLS